MNDTIYRSSGAPLRVSEDIVPLGEFRTHAARVLERLREENRAVVITQNGRPAAVLVTPEEYDRLHEHRRFVSAVEEGLADVDAGRIAPDDAPPPGASTSRRRPRR